MAFPTFEDLINETIVELRQEPGVSVQQYAEDVIAAIMQRMFNTFFDHYWWPEYTTSEEVFTLNGTDGKVTQDLTAKIKRIDDVRYIWYESDPNPLTAKPAWINSSAMGFRKYYEPVAGNKIFRILPVTTTGSVRVTYRTKPNNFLPADEVKMDPDLLKMATAFNYLADDEDATNAIKKFADATAKRESQIREAMNKGPIPFGRAGVSPLNEWMTWP